MKLTFLPGIVALVCFFASLQNLHSTDFDPEVEGLVLSDDEWQEKKPYMRPASCSVEVWKTMEPYFLPENHPIRRSLDSIFSEVRVLGSPGQMRKAGFFDLRNGGETNVYVARHPRTPGYIFKFYTDTQELDDCFRLLRRIYGAELVQKTLDEYGFNRLIKTPKKWIYPIPPECPQKNGEGEHLKHFILVAQDVGALSPTGNRYAWKHSVSFDLLTAIYIVIQENRMTDSIRIQNIPFCYDGKVAFLDTEFFNVPDGEIRFWKLYDNLSSEMANYLKTLAEKEVSR